MKLRSMTCSDLAIIDASTNRISCINILDDVKMAQFPALASTFAVSAIFERSADEKAGDRNLELEISIDGDTIVKGPIFVAFQGALTTRAMITLNGFVYPRPGRLKASILDDGVEMGDWQFSVGAIEAVEQSAI